MKDEYIPRPLDAARLLTPRSVALIGISSDADSIGWLVLSNRERFGYEGDIYLVSRNNREINGRPCVATIDDLPEGIDAAMIGLAASGIRDAVLACGRRSVGAAVVFAAGFAEVGEEGVAAQAEMVAAAREAKVALLGPNCIGYMNLVNGAALSFDVLAARRADTRPGVGIIAQSGAMQTSLRLALLAKELNVTCSISTGNEADLCAEDFLSVLVDDAQTRVIVLFAEQIRHPQAFLALASQARAANKPVVLMHPGRSSRAQASALSHTGSLTGDHAVMRTLVTRQGVVMVETLEELVDVAEILLRFPVPPAKGNAIVTNSGAFKSYAIDFCESIGLELPVLADTTVAKAGTFLPSFAALENPLDTTAQSIKDPSILGKSLSTLLADEGVGSVVAAVIPGPPKAVVARAEALMNGFPADSFKPYVVSVFGDESPVPPEFAQIVRAKGACFIRSPDRALRAMAVATAYGQTRAQAREKVPALQIFPPLPGTGMLVEYQGKAFFASLGLAVPEGRLAADLASACQIAASIGYPVVLKAQSAALPHKSEAGGVIVNIPDEPALVSAWNTLESNVKKACPGLVIDGVLVEKMSPCGGIELVVGARRDPQWGPVVMAGLGGIWIEALKDVRLMAADLNEQEIVNELNRLRGAALLHGLRGAPAVDVVAVARAIALVGSLMRSREEITEIDINPLMAYPKGVVALDVLLVSESPR
jgi:acyl-CoA synthetase (NDP forming)